MCALISFQGNSITNKHTFSLFKENVMSKKHMQLSVILLRSSAFVG